MSTRSLFSPSSRCLVFCLLFGLFGLAGCRQVRRLFGQKETNPHSVTIQWTASKTPVAGYNVYRSDPPGLTIKLTVRLVTETQYVDHTAQGGHTYVYSVTSVDNRGLESVPSEKITIAVPTTSPSK